MQPMVWREAILSDLKSCDEIGRVVDDSMHDGMVSRGPAHSIAEGIQASACLAFNQLHSSFNGAVAPALAGMCMLRNSCVRARRCRGIVMFEESVFFDISSKVISVKWKAVASGFANGILKEADHRTFLIRSVAKAD